MSDHTVPPDENEKTPSLLKRLTQLLRGDDPASQMRESIEEVI